MMGKWITRYKYTLLATVVVIGAVVFYLTRDRAPVVKVATARVAAISSRLAASGLVETRGGDLSFPVSGRVSRLYVQEGDRVTESEVLARLDPFGAINATSTSGQAIQAPYDGTVVTIYQRQGTVVNPGQPVLRVVAASGVWVTAFVESEDATHLQPGHKLRCRVGGYLSGSWELTVESIGREAIPRPDLPGSSRQVRVRCRPDSPAFAIPPGTEVDVDGDIPLPGRTVVIPAAAVMHEGQRNSVWVVSGNAVQRQEVMVGGNNFDLIQIREGLDSGAEVVVEGKEALAEGDRVKPEPMPPDATLPEGG